MAGEPIHILLVEDNPGEARLLSHGLSGMSDPLTVTHVPSMADAARELQRQPFAAVLLDLSLPDSWGLDTLQRTMEAAPHVPILVLTGWDDEAIGIEALRLGAQDYLIKGQVDGRLVLRAIRYAIERKRAEEEIRELNRELEDRVNRRTALLRAMTFELAQVEQRERRRLAEVLHDHLQQLLVAAKFRVTILRKRADSDHLHPLIDEVDDMLDQSITASRSLTVELSPPILYDGGLKPALEWLARQMEEKHGLAVDVTAEPRCQPNCRDIAVMLFQFIRELLFNIVKHAGVKTARVDVNQVDADWLQVVVADQGAGFAMERASAAATAGGFGLFSIRERLQMMGGRLEVETAPGQGSRITILAPTRLPANLTRAE